MNRFLTLTVILLAIFPSVSRPASAQTAHEPYLWRSVKVGAGGFIPGIIFSRAEKNLVYLRSDMGGCYRWDGPQQRWIPLQDPMAESSYFGGESIAPDPIDPNTVYIAAGMYRSDPSAILRSHDRGNTWQIFPVSFRMGGNEDGRGVGERVAIDPNDNAILFFGSRHDGLWRSENYGETWQKVKTFPLKGRGLPVEGQPTNTGLSFVVFDPHTGTRGSATRTLFVGSADPGSNHLFRSDDAGATWRTVPGGPGQQMLPAQAQIDDSGILFLTYGNGTGPNGVTDGAVMKFDSKTEKWTDISPTNGQTRLKSGYCGLSLDRQHSGTLGVATMNHWNPGDTVWRTTDAGRTWKDIAAQSQRDVQATPFLLWGKHQSRLGWWMAAFAIDPFDSNHAAYSTGATIYATRDFSNVSANRPTHWFPWVAGIEQTAIITLVSPPAGAHLLSGFGDIGGFVHDDLKVSPSNGMYENPHFDTTISLDYAGQNPLMVVRSGQPADEQASLAYSQDGGRSWQPLDIPPAQSSPSDGHPAIIVSADGSMLMVLTRIPIFTRDRGQTWTEAKGLPVRMRPVADRVDPSTFYAIDFNHDKFLTSTDAGATFHPLNSQGLPSNIKADEPTWREGPWPLQATPGKAHDLWFITPDALYHSPDAGIHFSKAGGQMHPEFVSFGKTPPGKDYPAIFAAGTLGGVRAIWRSDDLALSWVRVNDDQHQYGARFRCIAGDPRIFGRVYVGTDGRGILYGQPVGAKE